MTIASTMADTEGIDVVRLNFPLRQNCSIFMSNFPEKFGIKYQIIRYNFHIKLSFVNLDALSRNPGSAPASTIYFIYMGQPIWDPYGTRLHSPYGSHMDTHIGPIWIPYRSLAGI